MLMKFNKGLISVLTGALIGIFGLESKTQAATTTNVWPGITNVYAGPITNNCTIRVIRKPEYKVNVNSQNGVITGDANDFYPSGRQCAITNTPSTGYHFAGWMGDTNGCTINGNVINVPADMPRNLTASNAINTYTITTSYSGEGSILPKTATVTHGASKALQMIPNSYYKINSASKDGEPIPEAEGQDYYSLQLNDITNNHTVNANFDPKRTAGGTPHIWYANHGFTNPSNELDEADTDEDGYKNRAEYTFGTNPTNSSSCLNFRIRKNGNNQALSWSPSSSNCEYRVLFADKLINCNWQTNYVGFGTGEQEQTLTETNSPSSRFYRLTGKRTD